MTGRMALLVPLLLVPGAAAAQTRPDSLVVYPGAAVRLRAPSLGGGTFLGKFATAKVRGTTCYGAAVTLPGGAGAPSLILLRGISHLEVDRRTNLDVAVVGLEPATDADWEPIDLQRLRVQDSACALQGKANG